MNRWYGHTLEYKREDGKQYVNNKIQNDNWVDYSDLVYSNNNGKIKVDWKKSCGKKIICEYNGVKFDAIVKEYQPKVQKVLLESPQYGPLLIKTTNLRNCKLGGWFKIKYTHPHLSQYFLNGAEAKYTAGSNAKIELKCPNCQIHKKMIISHLVNDGFSCDRCSDGISIPNKFCYGILEQLGIEYEREKEFDFLKERFYDVFLPKQNIIIENHGIDHYEETGRGPKLSEIRANDELKKNTALKNSITNYLVVDCRKSTLEYLQKNFEDTLGTIFDLSIINWEKVWKDAQRSLVFEACKMFNEIASREDLDAMPYKEIANKYQLSVETIRRYIKVGREIGLISYDRDSVEKKVSKNGGKIGSCKPIFVFDKSGNKRIFDSIKDCETQSDSIYGQHLRSKNIQAVCAGDRNHYKGFVFRYIDEVGEDFNLTKDEIKKLTAHQMNKSVICISPQNKEYKFLSIRDCINYFKDSFGITFSSGSIREVCRGRKKTHQGYRFNYSTDI